MTLKQVNHEIVKKEGKKQLKFFGRKACKKINREMKRY